MAPPIFKLLRLSDIGKGLVQNATTKLVDLAISTATGQGIFLDGSNALYCPPGQRVGENLFRNPSFNINQKSLTGTVTLASGQYGHDGLVAGANGATYTFAKAANGYDTIITITAGQLIMPVAAELITGDTLCFIYTGTASFRIATNSTVAQFGAVTSNTVWNAPSVAQKAGGFNLTPGAGQQVNFMFGDGTNKNAAVTFSVPSLELAIGAVTPTRFQRRDPAVELAICQRYGPPTFCDVSFGTGGNFPTLGAGAFNTIICPTVNSDQGVNYNASTGIYTCPVSGLYQLTGNIRLVEDQTNGMQVGIGVYSSSVDGQWFHWNVYSYVSGVSGHRTTFEYVRTGVHNKGDQLRLYSYSDQGYQYQGAGMQIAFLGALPRGLVT